MVTLEDCTLIGSWFLGHPAGVSVGDRLMLEVRVGVNGKEVKALVRAEYRVEDGAGGGRRHLFVAGTNKPIDWPVDRWCEILEADLDAPSSYGDL